MNFPQRLALESLVLVLLVSGCSNSAVDLTSDTARSATDQTAGNRIRKSPNDDREYRHLVLENGLRLVLISDPQADKSAASLVVFRGSYDDPEDRPGLAHFLEHMLFIGTHKYPEPDGYFKFVQAHGGSSNAYTAAEHTNYFFDIQPEYFHAGLDRFAQFFISPLLQKTYAEREKNAVNSEYQLQLKEDLWRRGAVARTAMNPEHPAARFRIGSLETLSGDVQTALIRFFEEHYSANQMGLVVLSTESLDEMQPWVVEMFSSVRNRNLPQISRTTPLFSRGQLPARLSTQSLRRTNTLSYEFPMPPARGFYRTKPLAYIVNLTGHEGEGSLHKMLVGKGWITSLGASALPVDDSNTIFSIAMILTDEGMDHIPEITTYLFGYLDLLRSEGAAEWLYDENASLAELAFRFKEKSSELGTVLSIGPGLAYFPAEDLLVVPFLMEEFDPELIQSFLSWLREDNVLMSISAPELGGASLEPWFKVPYDLTLGPVTTGEFDAEDLSKEVSASLHLPPVNPFVPESMALVAGGDGLPQPVIATGPVEIYFATDVEFGVPRAATYVSIRNEGGLIDRADRVRANLYARLVLDDLNALAYPALLAGVGYEIATPRKGFRLSIGGYHDKQLLLLDEVLTRLLNLRIDPERFAVIKADIMKALENTKRDKPYQQVYARVRETLVNSSWTAEQLIASLEPVTLPDLVEWRNRTLASSSVQALLLGNVSVSRADDLLQLLADHLEFSEVAVGESEVVTVSTPDRIEVNVEHDDAAMALYVQDNTKSYRDRAQSALLAHLIRPGYFSSLRTEQQLGYAVFAGNRVFVERGGISFAIQSPVVGPDELRARTLAFMDAQVDELAVMSEEEFAANKDGLVTRLLQKDNNLLQRAQRYWADLDLGITSFDSNVQLADEVKGLSKAAMLGYLDEVRGKLQNQYLMVFSTGKFADQPPE